MWVKLDDGAAEHPKIQGLSGAALRVWFRGLCHSARHLSDGRIRRHEALGWAFAAVARGDGAAGGDHEAVLRELTTSDNGSAPLWHEDGDCYVIHDWADYQPSAETVLAKRAEAAERMRLLREGRACSREHSGERSSERSGARSPVRSPGSRSRSRSPDPVPDPPPDTDSARADARSPAAWATKWKRPPGTSPRRLEAAVVRALREMRQAVVVPERAGTAAGEVRRLWSAVGRPDVDTFAEELVLVARAAQMSGHKLFARDIRAEGWAEGTDRTNDVATLTVQRRWDDRLRAAREWEASTGRRVEGVALCRRQRWPGPGAPDQWVALDPPVPLVAEYLRVGREALAALDGSPAAAVARERLAEVESSGRQDAAAATDVVEAVLAACGRW